MNLKYLERNYYENDMEGFYSRNMNLSCPEQMVYQSLRNYNIDFDLFFCDDINITITERTDIKYYRVYTNNLNLYHDWFYRKIVTEDYKYANAAITYILNMEKVVIFQAPTSMIKSFAWYNGGNPPAYAKHNSVIVGEDDKNYFYLDSPPTRNKQFFVHHPQNSAIGIIKKDELFEAFKVKCNISYIDIRENKIKKELYGIACILINILKNYRNSHIICGREALINLRKILENGYNCNFYDPFVSNLIGARYKKLKFCGLRDGVFFQQSNIIKIIDELIEMWGLIENLMIKYKFTKSKIDIFKICATIEKIIILNDKFEVELFDLIYNGL